MNHFQLRALYPLIEDICKDLRTHIDQEIRIVGSSGIDARELCAKFTTDIVSNSVFALDSGSLRNKDSIIRKMGKELFKPGFRLMYHFIAGEFFPSLNSFLKIPVVPKYVSDFFTKVMTSAAE